MNARSEDFWSRRKAAVAAEAEVEVEVAPDLPADDISDKEILASLEIPDPDTLTLGDDIKGFMSNAVPEHLRRRALRKLWRLNPVLANVDGLVDYGQDFTDSAMVIENLQTAYQVGKGMMSHVQEMTRQAEAVLDDLTDEKPAEDVEEEQIVAEVAEAQAAQPIVPEAEPVPVPRRRMQFSYDTMDEVRA